MDKQLDEDEGSDDEIEVTAKEVFEKLTEVCKLF